MKNMKKILFTIALLSSASQAHALAHEKGKIGKVFVDQGGTIAFQLDTPFTSNECATTNGWAALPTNASKTLITTLLTAKTASQDVKVVLKGCHDINAYINATGIFLE